MPVARDETWTLPRVSVVIPTCNRPDDVRRCLSSLSQVEYPNWEILLVDQGDDEATSDVAASFRSALPNLAYHRLLTKGSSRARNLGMRYASGNVFAFFDDDCTVDPGWLTTVVEAFERHREAALVFGQLISALDPSTTFVPECRLRVERVLSRRLDSWHARGVGASMYVRREATDLIGPWDDQLGSGGRFKGCSDWDYGFRLLRHGYTVVLTPSIIVKHFGGRPYRGGAASKQWRSIAYSQGALQMKHLRCGDPIALLWILVQACRHLSMARPLNLFRRGPSSHLSRIAYYLRGLTASFELPVDRQRRLYVDPQSPIEEWQAASADVIWS